MKCQMTVRESWVSAEGYRFFHFYIKLNCFGEQPGEGATIAASTVLVWRS